MVDDQEAIDTVAALEAARQGMNNSRQVATLWDRMADRARSVYEENHFRHTWADGVIRHGGQPG